MDRKMMGFAHKFSSGALICLLLFVISGAADAYETDTVQFNATLGFGEYGFDSGYMGLDDPLARMQVHVYGMLGLNLADVTMNGSAWTDNGRIGVTGTSNGGTFSFNLGLEYGAYAYYGIPVLGLDYELDLLTLLGTSSLDLRLNDSQTFTPFLLDSSLQISDSLPPENVLNIDLTDILFPGIPFVGAGVSLDADIGLEETLSGGRIYFSNPGSSIYSESGTLAFSGRSTILTYYENANADVVVGFWPGLYAEAFGYRFDFPIARIPFTVYSSDLPLPFNNSAVNFSSTTTSLNVSATLSPSSNVSPYSTVNVSGNVTYNTGGNVPVGTVDIDTGENVYTAAINNGSFSRDISAPSSSRNIAITAHDSEFSLDQTIYKWIDIQGDPGVPYTLSTDTVYNYVDHGDWVEWEPYIKPAFRTTDESVDLFTYFDNLNIDHDLDLKWRFFYPNGNQYGSDLVKNDAIKSYWDWGWSPWGFLIDGQSMAYNPGRYKIKFYVDNDKKRTHYYTVAWDFTEHRLCKDVGSYPHLPIGETDVFYQTDTKAVTWANFDLVAQGGELKCLFYEPSGALYSEVNSSNAPDYKIYDPGSPHSWSDWSRGWAWIWINGYVAANKCGNWRAEFFVKNPTSGSWEKYYDEYFQIIENPSVNPSVSVSAVPSTPFETQSVTLNLMATDNTYLDTVELHWKIDGVEQTPEVSSNINNGQKNISRNIGSFSSSQQIEYWGVAIDTSGNRAESQHTAIAVLSEVVTTPDRPSGEAYLQVGQSGTYTTGGGTTSFGHSVEYDFDWDDGNLPDWGSATQNKSWPNEGYYYVTARARCQTHTNRKSAWSTPITVTVDSTNPIVDINTNGGADFETTEPNVVIEGTVLDPNFTSGLASVSINTDATNEGTLSNWRFTVDLVDGNNPLTITATDNAGNSGEDRITVTYIPYVPGPDIRVPESSYDYNSVVVGSYEDWILTIYNDGGANLSITDFNGLEVSDFNLVGPPSLPFTIEPNESNDLTVRFAPSSGGIKTAKLSISSNDPDPYENPTDVNFVGMGVPSVLYVNANSPNDPGSGTLEDPYRHIQDGINAAIDGVEVHVAEGWYNESLTIADGNDIYLFGGCDGNDWTAPRDPNTNETIIDANGLYDSVIHVNDVNVTIDGFTITNGFAEKGGGIFASNCNLILANCDVENNRTLDGTDALTFPDEATDGGDGAGLYFSGSGDLRMSTCNVIGNMTGMGGDGAGWADGGDAGRGGGMCLLNAGIVSCYNCEISGNITGEGGTRPPMGGYAGNGGHGGGIYCSDFTMLILEDCIITGNGTGSGGYLSEGTQAGNAGNGGGIYCSSVEMKSCTVTDNATGNGGNTWQSTGGGYGGSGGGLYCFSETVASRLENCIFTSNRTGSGGLGNPAGFGGHGGAVYCLNGEIIDCNFISNETGNGGRGYENGDADGSPGGAGGGIYGHGLTIINSRIFNNATGNGGDGYCEGGYQGNGASAGDGGGAYCESCNIYGSIIAFNSTGNGGNGCGLEGNGGNGGDGAGLYAPFASTTNCTIVNNLAGYGGNGSFNGDDGVAGLGAGVYADSNNIIINTIIWDNSPDQLAGQDCNNVTYCDIGEDVCLGGTGNISVDPCFVDPNNNDYHLQYGSHCIDTGDPNYVAEANEFDIDGDARIIGGRIDIGVDEYRYGELCDLYKDGIVNFKDFSILAYYWMDYLCSESDWCDGSDFDESRYVDIGDLKTFAENWLWQAAWYNE